MKRNLERERERERERREREREREREGSKEIERYITQYKPYLV